LAHWATDGPIGPASSGATLTDATQTCGLAMSGGSRTTCDLLAVVNVHSPPLSRNPADFAAAGNGAPRRTGRQTSRKVAISTLAAGDGAVAAAAAGGGVAGAGGSKVGPCALAGETARSEAVERTSEISVFMVVS
jgi:hypothetical protein